MERDLQVEQLVYRLETGEGLRFAEPPPLPVDTAGFNARLENGILTVTMKDHYASVEAAKERVGPFLRNWELAEALVHGKREMWFTYQDCKIVDRADPNATILVLDPARLVLTGQPVVLIVTRGQYPPPPTNFTASHEVEILWTLYEDYRAGRVRLTDLGYFCLTVLESTFGGGRGKKYRPAAAAALRIDLDVLNTLGDLVSEKGDERTARKIPKGGWQTHHERELMWMGDVVRKVIRRAGEQPPHATPISMADFPPLP